MPDEGGNVGPPAKYGYNRETAPSAGSGGGGGGHGFYLRRGPRRERFHPSVDFIRSPRTPNVLLTEAEVEKILRSYLKKKGFAVTQRTGAQGVDIFARSKSSKEWYVEVEGNKRPNGGPLTTSQKYTHLLRAVGQISTRMTLGSKGFYALGLPADSYYQWMIQKQLSEGVRRLGLTVFWVRTKGKVSLVKPTRS